MGLFLGISGATKRVLSVCNRMGVSVSTSRSLRLSPSAGAHDKSVLKSPLTGGEGSLTQRVHCEFIVSFEAIRPVITQQVCCEFF